MSMQTAPYHQPATLEEVRTLWIGDLPYWADESYLRGWFSQSAEVLSVKAIRNKITGQPEGYGFVEFTSHQAAEAILQSYNGAQIPGTQITFRLNWASFGNGERRIEGGPDHSIFVGDLAPDVTDYLLQETFRASYPSVRGAKVVTDPLTGGSKGYGFVKFADEMEKNRAMVEMNGAYCSTRPMRISAATPKKTTGAQQQYAAPKAAYPTAVYTTPLQAAPADNTVNHTTDAGVWGQSTDTTQWSGYYPYGQGYDAYAYGATGDPSAYPYGAYAGYSQYPHQMEGAPEGTPLLGVAPPTEHKEEIYDPLAVPDVDKLNAAYLSVHRSAILGRPLWRRTSSMSMQA